MSKKLFGCLFYSLTVFLLLINFSIRSQASRGKSDLDRFVKKVSKELIKIIPRKDGILVSDFQDLGGRTTYFGKYLSERIHINLANLSSLKVLERHNINTLLEEKRLADVGLIDDYKAIKIGQTVGATIVIYGTIADLEDYIGLNLKVVDIERGTLVAGLDYKIKRTKELAILLEKITGSDKKRIELQEDEKKTTKRKEGQRLNENSELQKRVIGENVKIILLSERLYPEISVNNVSWAGMWGNGLPLGVHDEDVGSYTIFFGAGDIGSDWSAASSIAKKQAAKIGCDNYYLVSANEFSNSKDIASVTYHCIRTQYQLEREATKAYFEELGRTEFGEKWLGCDPWRNRWNINVKKEQKKTETELKKDSKGGLGKESEFEVDHYRSAYARILVDKSIKCIQGIGSLYVKDYELISAIQEKYENNDVYRGYYPSLPSLKEDGSIDIQQYIDELKHYYITPRWEDTSSVSPFYNEGHTGKIPTLRGGTFPRGE